MKILVIYEGVYGERIYQNICSKAPGDWEIFSWQPPVINEVVLDEPEIYIPDELPETDLIMHLAENAQAAQLIPDVVEKTGAKGVIVSIDCSDWVPLGLRNQLKRELNKMGVEIVFPEPLCSLDTSSAGFGEANEPYSSEVISRFAEKFGRPSLEVTLDEEGKLEKTEVLRGSPCGSTEYTAKRINGRPVDGLIPSAGLMCLHYPCLASMKLEQRDGGIDTIMHTAGKIFNASLEEALNGKESLSEPETITEREESD